MLSIVFFHPRILFERRSTFTILVTRVLYLALTIKNLSDKWRIGQPAKNKDLEDETDVYFKISAHDMAKCMGFSNHLISMITP